MKSRSRRPWVFGGLALLLLLTCVGLLIWAIHQFGWDWTGFNAYSPPRPQYQRGKTLWDWLQLLIVPAILAAGAGVFAWWRARTERQIAQRRYEQDQELALDKQRADLLQSYLDRMAELLLEKGLRASQPNAEVRKVARTRTVSTLIQLDGKRTRTIFVFLGEAQLTEQIDPIISFEDADLSSAKWGRTNLSGFNLSKATLSEANLNEALLSGTNLSEALLNGADLSGAYLFRANLFRATLSEANLNGANLHRTNLRRATLSGATLRRATLSRALLNGADLSGALLSGAILNDVQYLESAQLDKTILRGVKGLTPEQLAHCKTYGAIVDEEVMPLAPPLQSATVTVSQGTILQTVPLPGQAVISTPGQEATSEASSSQEQTAVKQEATPPTPVSPSQEDTPSVSPTQGSATAPSSSQDAVS